MKSRHICILLATLCFCLNAIGADVPWPPNIRALAAEVERVQATDQRKAMLLLGQFLPKCKPLSDDNLQKTIELFNKVLARPLEARTSSLKGAEADFDAQVLVGCTLTYLHGARITGVEAVVSSYLEKVSPLVNWSNRQTATELLGVLDKVKLDEPQKENLLRKVVSTQLPTHPEGRMALMHVASHPAAREVVWEHLGMYLGDPQTEGAICQLLMNNPQVMKGRVPDVAALLVERIKANRENHAFKSGLVPLLMATSQPGDLNTSATEFITFLRTPAVAYPIKAILAALIVLGVNHDQVLTDLTAMRTSLFAEAIQWRAKHGREQKSTCLASLLDLPALLLFPGPEAPALTVSRLDIELALQAFEASDEIAKLDRGFLAVVLQQVFGIDIPEKIISRLGPAYTTMYATAETSRSRKTRAKPEFMSEDASQKIKAVNNNDLIAMTFYPALAGGDKIVADALAAARFRGLTGLLTKQYAVLADLYGTEKVTSWIAEVMKKCPPEAGIYLEFYELGLVNQLPGISERSGKLLGDTSLAVMTIEKPDVLYVMRLLLACRKLGIHAVWMREMEAKLLAKRNTLGSIVAIYAALRDQNQDALDARGIAAAVAICDVAELLPVLKQLCTINQMSLSNASWENAQGMLRHETTGGSTSLAYQYRNAIALISLFDATER